MQLTIRLPDDQMRQIEAIARKMGLKKSDVARMAIRDFIADHTGETTNYPYERVRPLLGVAESGIPDLGQKHREHLLKKIKKKN